MERTARRNEHAASFGGALPMTNLDLLLSTVVALGLPVACAWLFDRTGGALASLILYYAVGCVLVVRWRKGTLDYRWPVRWPWAAWGVSLLVPLAITANNWNGFVPDAAPWWSFVFTVVIWAPLNAAMEQLSWFYVLDAWRNRWHTGPLRRLGVAVGIGLLIMLVTLIHLLFWTRFLPVAEPARLPWATIPLNLLLTATYAWLYYRSRSMWPTFVIHLLVDLQLVLLPRYGMIADLW